MAEVALGTCLINKWPGSTEHILSLPGDWYEHLHVSGERDRVVLWAGNRRAVAEVVFTDDQYVQVTDSLRKALYLPLGRISVKAQDGELHFGPFVGLYALPSSEKHKPFGDLTAGFEDMMVQAAEEGVGLFVFLPGETEWDEGYAQAYVYKTWEKHWVQTKRPLPDLVLPKILVSPQEWKDRIRYDTAQMTRCVPYGSFSRSTGNKWEVHSLLHGDERTGNLLPETVAVKTPYEVEEMLERHRTLYVKPAWGTQGKAIYKLELDAQGVRAQYTQGGKSRVVRLRRGSPNWRAFLQKKFCGKRLFLAQQALDLVCVQGVRPVDFRWLMQKDGRNDWHVTARVARVGSPSAITTNLHTGGDAVLADEFLRGHGYREEPRREQLLAEIDEAALGIVTVLEAHCGRLGELGIDFGLTKAGEVYLIEVNPRPGRQMLKQTSLSIRALSLRRNLEYAKYTTGYQPQDS
ncbi:MAG: YheC/YheD family endospore coat-associated protein [Tumebacillaceae bacterium]